MKNFSSIYLTEPNKNTESDTNEVVGLILATMILSQAFMGLGGGGSKDSKGGGSSFWDWMINRDNNKKEKGKEKEKEAESGGEKKNARDNEAFNKLMMIARKSNQKEKDENTQKKNDAMIKLLTACSFDKDGKEIPLDQRLEKMKDTMSPEQFESFKKEMTETYEKNKDNQEFKDAVAKEAAKITPETYEKALEDAKKEAKATLEQLAKEKEEIEKWEKELADMEAAAKGEDDEDKKKKLEEEIKAKQQQAPQSLAGAATGVTGGGTPAESTGESTEEATEEATGEATGESTGESTGEPTKEPKDYSDDDIDALQNELSELDPEKDKDKIKEKEKLLKSIAKAKGKKEDDFIPKIDTGANGTVYQRKVGPQGGKYYRVKTDGKWGPWNPGEPATSESYTQMSLGKFLLERKENDYVDLKQYLLESILDSIAD